MEKKLMTRPHLDSHELPRELVQTRVDLPVGSLAEELPARPDDVARLDLHALVEHLRRLVLQGARVDAQARGRALRHLRRHRAPDGPGGGKQWPAGLRCVVRAWP